MSNSYFNFANSKEFRDLMLNLPPSNDAAFEHGFGYGEDFDPDYESILEAHSYEASKATCLNVDLPSGIPPHPPHPPAPGPLASTPVVCGDTPRPTVFTTTSIADATPVPAHPSIPSNTNVPTTRTSTLSDIVLTGADLSLTPPTTPAEKKGGRRRVKFPPAALEQLARVVYSINPYGAPHGKKAEAWEQVATEVKEYGYFKNSSMDTIRNKMSAMLAYFEVSSYVYRIYSTANTLIRILIRRQEPR